MSRNFLILLGVMVALGFVSAVLTYLRAEKMSAPADILQKGLAAVQRGNMIFFGLFVPILVGPLAYYIYRSMLARSPDTAQTSYLLLAAGIGIVFTLLAALVFRMRGFVEFTVLHILYVAGFGWMMPRLWAL
jgi:hypothetical protein